MKKSLKWILSILALVILVLVIYANQVNQDKARNLLGQIEKGDQVIREEGIKTAMFAGGCFWCTEADFEKVPGVISAVSGYAGGTVQNPTYQNYGGLTSTDKPHIEVVQVTYDPKVVSFKTLVEYLFAHIDPTDGGGQFVDRGPEYIGAIFFSNTTEKIIAEEVKDKLESSGIYEKAIVTPILATTQFWPAEEYHQDYSKKNPIRYAFYRSRSGRDEYLQGVCEKKIKKGISCDVVIVPEITETVSEGDVSFWKNFVKPSDSELQKILSPLQYEVTQHEGTEEPFNNEYNANHEEGIYVDRVSGEPLFSSKDKYESGTGWPSFTKPLVSGNIVTKEDNRLIGSRIEVRSRYADSHLGHVFPDGPAPTGLRYCMNSAALRFIPQSELEQQGYSEFVSLFK